MQRSTTRLRALVKRGKFLELPSAYDPLIARLAESLGFQTVYNGGFVTGGATCISEPLLTMDEQIRVAADEGADMGLIFPRDHDEAVKTPKLAKIPMIYVQSRGNRDSRPLYNYGQLRDMGYAGCIDAILGVGVQFHFMRQALTELKKTGDYGGIDADDFVAVRKQVEDLIGLDDYYRIERETVEKRPAKRRWTTWYSHQPKSGV